MVVINGKHYHYDCIDNMTTMELLELIDAEVVCAGEEEYAC